MSARASDRPSPGTPLGGPESRHEIYIERLRATSLERTRELFTLIAEVFEMDTEPLGDAYLTRLLEREDFWAMAAFENGRLVGGLTAHTLPLTRAETQELFLYDIAVRPECQRQGVGRQLVAALRARAAAAGIQVLFVAADEEDSQALDFYRAMGGSASPVTIFRFGGGAG